jgi:protein TonB
MPADLFRPNVAATPSRRRASLLPVSIVLHAITIAAFLIVPLLADVELPRPNTRVATPYIPVLPIAPPVVKRSTPASAKPLPSAPNTAPAVVPDTIAPEREIATMGDTLPGSEFGLPEGVDPGMVPGEAAPPPAPPKPAPPTRVRAGGQIQPPRKIVNVVPVYPAFAQSSRVQGKVVLEALIGVDGRVENLRVVQPAALLTDAAIAAVRQWVFTPTKLNGEPVQVVMMVTVDFTLQ